jgi:hypothetical protein
MVAELAEAMTGNGESGASEEAGSGEEGGEE